MRSILASAAAGALMVMPAAAQEDAAAAPTDYAVDEHWLCLPGRDDACAVDIDATVIEADGSTRREVFEADADAPIDCFYVYPTVSLDNFTTSDLVAGPEELSVVRTQLARFGQSCRLFAPMYRQFTLPALRARMGGEAPPARGTPADAAADVDAAFEHYLENYNEGRGIVLIGHSQGAGQIARLAGERFDGKPLQDRLVSALILGSSVQVPEGGAVGGTFEALPACTAADQFGCVISYATFHEGVPASETSFFGAGQGDTEALCTNPAALGGGEAEPIAYFSAAAPYNVALGETQPWLEGVEIDTPFVRAPGLVTTECVRENGRSFLEVRVHGDPDGPRADDIGGHVMRPTGPDAGWGLHLIDVNVGIGDLANVIAEQGRAWAAAQD